MNDQKKPSVSDFVAGVITLFFLGMAGLFIFFVVAGLSVKAFNWIVQ